MHETKDIKRLTNELTYHRYMLNQGQVRSLFQDISISEYIALHHISQAITKNSDGSDRTYLKDIAQELRLSVPQASKMIGALRDKGLVSWAHDGDGREGTYIVITDSGLRLMKRQEAFLEDYYTRVAEKFGEDNLAALLQLMIQLEAVMDAELSDRGDGLNDI